MEDDAISLLTLTSIESALDTFPDDELSPAAAVRLNRASAAHPVAAPNRTQAAHLNGNLDEVATAADEDTQSTSDELQLATEIRKLRQFVSRLRKHRDVLKQAQAAPTEARVVDAPASQSFDLKQNPMSSKRVQQVRARMLSWLNLVPRQNDAASLCLLAS